MIYNNRYDYNTRKCLDKENIMKYSKIIPF